MARPNIILASLVVLTACGSSAAPDAGPGVDSGVRDSSVVDSAAPDASPTCEPACGPTDECCADAMGVAHCINPRVDVENCGGCGSTCLGGRGTECALGACVCGRVDFGCGGTDESTCCLPGPDRVRPYCANLRRDGDDCGACGAACDADRANFCDEGACVCGTTRGTCTGAPESRCCVDALGFAACVDTTSENGHCGVCGHRCAVGETCLSGVCSLGPEVCTGACGDGDICCHGSCCPRVSCDRGECGMDAGAADAGAADSGAADSGAADSGAADSGVARRTRQSLRRSV